ncbi:4-(cytidine 5'-diphospho)-2-C-methyl-D-erythritol kinase [Waterburya agarophytonicola K14]|uniref:4-diphosphocytidyl-2-C-methyl-D-erythritol kinase n=1 Tax=Waterburya agarophytonicola KI4 TaxID=2874699 RepID=A0A964FG79_9CYAN|nr:4-(cytidine 5'-diphospho)-2-C-methyl-D-erythritol kinase [Waterburya agarophytonicola]MCC0177897.1 4-(cytidine 5'-diphospho)-2-C-methyl-D-erythritol kinase [Waterburya agarophytonicola KI4]
MQSYSLLAPAKINLLLEIIGDRPDGFHELVMVLQSVELADRIDIQASDTQEIYLKCDHPEVPEDETNLAYRAAKLMFDTFPEVHANYGGVTIKIKKNIPVAAGLAGGSGNAAAVLVGINLIWKLGLTQPELQDLAAKLGSDIPFCVSGGTAIATGRGEKLASLKNLTDMWVVLAKYDNISVSTPWAYQTYRQEYNDSYISDAEGVKSRTAKVHSSPLLKAIAHKDSAEIGKQIYNDLEKVVLPQYPQVAALKAAFAAQDILGTMMSGSGPTVFALCESESKAIASEQQVRSQIRDPHLKFWITKLSSKGIQVLSSN